MYRPYYCKLKSLRVNPTLYWVTNKGKWILWWWFQHTWLESTEWGDRCHELWTAEELKDADEMCFFLRGGGGLFYTVYNGSSYRHVRTTYRTHLKQSNTPRHSLQLEDGTNGLSPWNGSTELPFYAE
jgi:hypothetical protein